MERPGAEGTVRPLPAVSRAATPTDRATPRSIGHAPGSGRARPGGGPPWHRGGRVARWAVASLAACLSLAACGTTSPAKGAAPSGGTPVTGGTAVYAHEVGDNFTWIFPIPNATNLEAWDQNTAYDFWPQLYAPGVGTSPDVNEADSLAYPPVWSNGDTTVTVRLRRYLWSDGTPVTTKDVKFFFQLYDANKSQIGTYIPGDLPDNVASVDYVSPTEFVLHLTHRVAPTWYLLNQLSLIVPLPAQSWDRTSMSSPAGSAASTPPGAKAVFTFLNKQSETVSTYATNPLWQVVDGPFRISAYNPATFQMTMVPNPRYSGTIKPRLSKVVMETFPSDTAELDALRSGQLDYGFLPYSDLALKGLLEREGYTVAPWIAEFNNYWELGYTSPVYGPLVRQLYLRQALQHLVDDPLFMKKVLHGIGALIYGPVPSLPGSKLVDSTERADPDPYSVAAARALLLAHGWRQTGPGGVMVCAHPGTGSGECGAGIAAGRQLQLLMIYMTGYPTMVAEAESFQSSAAQAGVKIVFEPESQTTMFSNGGVCPPGPCNWGIVAYANYLWNYTQTDAYPTGGIYLQTGNYWGGGYSSPTADKLIAATHTEGGLAPLYAYENYVSRDIAGLWVPVRADRISVVKDTLRGWEPQQIFANPLPARWYEVR